MENTRKPGSRQRSHYFNYPVLRRSLLRGAGRRLTCCYYCLLLLLPALSGSCRKEPGPAAVEEEENPPAAVVDSVLTHVRLRADGSALQSVDVFIYGSGGTRALEAHFRTEQLPEDGWDIPTLPGEKLAVGIANSPKRFNQKALERYDSMEQLAFRFAEDDPHKPILGGVCTTSGQEGEIILRPLLCKIVLASVSNTMDGYELLEEPRVRLRDLPDAAEILREQEFRPSELIDAGDWAPLPFDVGYFPQEPGIELWCYPNDTPENILGVPRPSLEFECRIRGETCSFDIPLPPLTRGCTQEVELTVDGPDNHRYKIRQK